MEDELQGLRRQASAVASAPLLFAIIVLAAVAAIWGVLHLSYQAILAGKDRHIAALERRIADYRHAVGGATADEARRRIEAMELELKTLRLRTQPRRLTPEQSQAIVDRSRLPAGAAQRAVTVVVEQGCSDCKAFADELVAALRDSQAWSVETVATANPADKPRNGLALRVADRLRPPSDAVVLQQALRSATLDFTMLSGGAGATIELLVTERVPQ